jgi:hypothetical protein
MTDKPTQPQKSMSDADRALCEKAIDQLQQLQMKISDPGITTEQMQRIEAMVTPPISKLLSYWQAKRSRPPQR